MSQYTLFIALAPLAAAVSIIVAYLSWHRRRATHIYSLTWYLVCITAYLILNLLELLDPTLEGKIAWLRLQYLFIPTLPLCWFIFALEYTGRREFIHIKRLAPFCLIPLMNSLVVILPPFTNLLWQKVSLLTTPSGFLFLQIEQQLPLSVFFTVYSYILFIASSFMIAMGVSRVHRLFRLQSTCILIGTILPVIISLISVFGVLPSLHQNYTPLAFAFSGICFAIGIYQYQLLDIMPVARSLLVEIIHEGMIVLDHNERIVDMNSTAITALGLQGSHIIGSPASQYLPFWKENLAITQDGSPFHEITLPYPSGIRSFEIRVVRLNRSILPQSGYLVTMIDTTYQRKLRQEVENLARIDPLTSTYNRRFLMELGERELERSRRYEVPLSIILLDVDHFKEINDVYGHLAGDRVLIGMSEQLRSCLRSVDIIARFGGDEFIVLLPETSSIAASQVAERLRREIEMITTSELNDEQTPTISLGIASTNDGSCSMDQLLETADRALYRSKNFGRNRITAFAEVISKNLQN